MNASAEEPKNENNASDDSTNIQPNFTEISMNSRSAETTGYTENRCAISVGPSGSPRGLIAKALIMPVDKEEEAKRLIDQIIDPEKTLGGLTSRMDGAWKFPVNGLIKKNTTEIVLKNAIIIKSILFLC